MYLDKSRGPVILIGNGKTKIIYLLAHICTLLRQNAAHPIDIVLSVIVWAITMHRLAYF